MNEASKQKARERAAKLAPKPTPAMVNFLTILLGDCGFTERLNRNAYLSRETEREIKYVDDLTFDEAHRLISELKARREENKMSSGVKEEEEW